MADRVLCDPSSAVPALELSIINTSPPLRDIAITRGLSPENLDSKTEGLHENACSATRDTPAGEQHDLATLSLYTSVIPLDYRLMPSTRHLRAYNNAISVHSIL